MVSRPQPAQPPARMARVLANRHSQSGGEKASTRTANNTDGGVIGSRHVPGNGQHAVVCVCTLSPGGGFAVETLRFAGTDAHPVSALARTNTPPRLPARLQRYTYCTGLPTTRAARPQCRWLLHAPGRARHFANPTAATTVSVSVSTIGKKDDDWRFLLRRASSTTSVTAGITATPATAG